MKTIAFVPVKLNNERLPHKNLLPFSDGQPLLVHILETLGTCSFIDEIYLFCSSEITVPLPERTILLRRDPDLDSSTTTANDLASAFAQKIPADYYIMTHATSPMISAASIQRGFQAVASGQYDSAFSVVRVC